MADEQGMMGGTTRRSLLGLAAGAGAGLALAAATGTGSADSVLAQADDQVSFQRASITLAAAARVVAAAQAKAREINVPMCIIIVDDAGQLKAAARMDGNRFSSIEIVTRKAITSAGFGAPTHVLGERLQSDALRLQSFLALPNVWLAGGGMPLMKDGVLLGGIGVGGGSAEQDTQVAEAGAAVL